MFYRRIAPELYPNGTNGIDSSVHEQPMAWLLPCFTEDDKSKRMGQTAKADRRDIRDAHTKARSTDRDVNKAVATRNELGNQKHKPSRKEKFGRFMQNLSLARNAI